MSHHCVGFLNLNITAQSTQKWLTASSQHRYFCRSRCFILLFWVQTQREVSHLSCDLHPAVNPQERRCFRLQTYVLSVWISQMQQRAPRQKWNDDCYKKNTHTQRDVPGGLNNIRGLTCFFGICSVEWQHLRTQVKTAFGEMCWVNWRIVSLLRIYFHRLCDAVMLLRYIVNAENVHCSFMTAVRHEELWAFRAVLLNESLIH